MADSNPRDVLVTFEVEGLDETLHVLEFYGEEAVSELFQFELVLAAESSTIKFDQVVGQPGLLTLAGEFGERYFHGVVSRFQQREKARRFTVYHVSLVPRAWRLLWRQDCRIFQPPNERILDTKTNKPKCIIGKVLDPAKVEFQVHIKGNKKPQKRIFCVQYRESDWNFVSRLLEEEGYFYYFEHQKKKHVLHLGNDYQCHPDIPGSSSTLEFHDQDPSAPGTEYIFTLYYTERARSGAVALNDYNFEKPTLKLMSNPDKKAKKDTDLEVYDYPGRYSVPEEGKTLAGVRLQEYQAGREEIEGRSDCIRFTSGHVFTLDAHPRKELNKKKFMLTSVVHVGEKHGDLEAGAVSRRIRYHNTFRGVLRKTTFVPPRVTPRPRVRGPQTAVVVGPKGEEIYTDKFGRVKVQFHWDRQGKSDENSSCWVRVSQLWAGKSWGAMYIPRIGQEVVVEFLEGDPDQPLITGRVYHAQNPVPYELPKDKTKSTIKSNSSKGGGGSNELRFEDKKGSEELYTHAQKDQNEVVENDMSTSVGNNQSISVTADRSVTVGSDETVTIQKGDRTRTVQTGKDVVNVDSSTRAVTVKGDTSTTVTTGNYTVTTQTAKIGLDAKTILLAKSGVQLDLKSKDITIDATKTLQAEGKSKLTLDSAKVVVTGTGEVTITSGSSTIKLSPTEIVMGSGSGQIKLDAAGVTIMGSTVKIN